MATSRKSTKPAVLEADENVDEVSTKQVVKAGIDAFVGKAGLDGGHHRYKAIRAIAYQAFSEAVDAGDFDGLVSRALKNADSLPIGWGLERSVAAEKPAPKAKAAPAKKAAAKAPAKAAAKPAARKRPTR